MLYFLLYFIIKETVVQKKVKSHDLDYHGINGRVKIQTSVPETKAHGLNCN